MKLFYCDVETGGTDHNIHALLQIAWIIEIDGVVQEEYTTLIKPEAKDVISKAAMEINGISESDLQLAPSNKDVYIQLINTLAKYIVKYDTFDKFFFIGYNAAFDYGFIRKFFERNGDKYLNSWFWHPYIDVMTIAADQLLNERNELKNFKLATVANRFGIDTSGKLHDALFDIKITKELYETIRGNRGQS